MSLKFEDLIVEIDDVLPKELCEIIIKKFEADTENKYAGITGTSYMDDGSSAPSKVSTDLLIPSNDKSGLWSGVDKLVYDSFTSHVTKYCEFLHDSFNAPIIMGKISDSGYQIQKTDKDGYYTWHTDDFQSPILSKIRYDEIDEHNLVPALHRRRIFTYIFYLNEPPEFEGGCTEFRVGPEENPKQVVPKTGKLLLFPANIFYVHQGAPVTSGQKYLATGWVSEIIEYAIPNN